MCARPSCDADSCGTFSFSTAPRFLGIDRRSAPSAPRAATFAGSLLSRNIERDRGKGSYCRLRGREPAAAATNSLNHHCAQGAQSGRRTKHEPPSRKVFWGFCDPGVTPGLRRWLRGRATTYAELLLFSSGRLLAPRPPEFLERGPGVRFTGRSQ